MAEKVVMDRQQFLATITRLAEEIVAKHSDLSQVVMVGIKRRGADIAHLLREEIQRLTAVHLPAFDLDITLYRDDIDRNEQNESLFPTYCGATSFMSIEKKQVILVDDVLFTGRTIRAGLDALIDFGRASGIELAVLIDRGHRELPIQGDYVGLRLLTTRQQEVKVHTQYCDGGYDVVLTGHISSEPFFSFND